jgi:hypothetical protein
MIISQGKELEAQHEVESFGDLLGQSGSSSMPPPAFEEATAAAVYDPVHFSDEIPEPGEEPPPFEPYEAECFEIGSGNIVSHDPHLNSDGCVLSFAHSWFWTLTLVTNLRRGPLSFLTFSGCHRSFVPSALQRHTLGNTSSLGHQHEYRGTFRNPPRNVHRKYHRF